MGVKISQVYQSIKGIRSNEGFYVKFKNNGNEDMRVNGSLSVPIVFTLEDLPEGQMILIQSISFLIGTDAIIDLDKFAGILKLLNGIFFEAGLANTLISTNSDVLLISSEQTLVTAGTGSNTFTLLNGRWDFTDTFGDNGSMLLNKDNLKISIRDDMTGVKFFRVSCHGILIEEN